MRRTLHALRQTSAVSLQPTIYALSTAPGRSAIAVVRVSGPATNKILQRLTNAPAPPPRVATLRKLFHPSDRSLLDRALTVFFPAPNSYTGEDIAEFHVHGSTAVVRSVFHAIGSCDSPDHGRVRYAEAGEFTRRAFDNDRLDLTQVEGIGKLLAAETEEQRRAAIRQAEGGLKTLYEAWRSQVIKCRALTEAIIDFGEDEGIESELYDDVRNRVRELLTAIGSHLKSSLRGSLLQTGIRTVLLGAPNAGKSSLINILAQRPASIVSPEPGTTRDVVEVMLDIGGFPCIVGDTAGLRQGTSIGTIEQEGMIRAKAQAERSDLRILVVDATRAILEALQEILPYCTSQDEAVATVLALNKIDLVQSDPSHLQTGFSRASGIPEQFIYPISCVSKNGIANLASGITEILSAMTGARDNVLATNERQRTLLKESQAHLQSFLEDYSQDIVLGAEELRYAADALGMISGRVDPEEILGVIFADFCIGK